MTASPEFLQAINASASPEVQMNENAVTLEAFSVYGKNPATTSGLTWGYYGGRWGGVAVASGTLALTGTGSPSVTNYIVVSKSTGAISISTSATNWNDAANYARAYKVVCGGDLVETVEDHRVGDYGVHGGGASTAYADFVGDVGSPGGGVHGLVPAPAAGDATAAKYLSADGTWAILPALSGRLDAAFSSTQGAILYRGASAWLALAPSTAERILKTNGTGANPAWIDDVRIIPFSSLAAPTASEELISGAGFITTVDLEIPASLTGSSVKAGVAATAQTDFLLQDDGATVATIRFAASGTTASFVSVSAGTIAAGSVIKVVSPASPDATLAEIRGSLHLYRRS
jgi:hypothetical protein